MQKPAHELTRKEMKGPDKFQVAAADAASWMSGHQKQLVVGVVAALAAVAVALGVSAYVRSQRDDAGSQLYRVIAAASGEISAIPLPNLDRPVYKSNEEKQRAVLSAAAQLRASHGGSRAATTAALLEGDAHLALQEWDKAIASYQAFLSAAPTDDSIRFGGLDGLARAQEGKGELEAAAKTYEQAAGVAFFKDRATLERARVLQRAGKRDEARKALESIGKDSPLQIEAQERLARLGK